MLSIEKYCNKESDNILIQMIGEHELSGLEREIQYIKELSKQDDFCFVPIKVEDWNKYLSPWEAPPVFGKDGFAGKGEDTFNELLDIIQSDILMGRDIHDVNLYIGGYSLSGLFALWSAYQTDIFKGVAAVSPSVWFPRFYDYIAVRDIKTESVYLSIGKKEEKVKNPIVSQVGMIITDIDKMLTEKINCKFEWNEGNHFNEPDLRTAKGFAWLL